MACTSRVSESRADFRILEGFHRLPFARFTSPHTNRRCEHDEAMTMIGASMDGEPIGLAVVWQTAGRDAASLESIFIDPRWRGRGIGRGLLAAVESRLILDGVRTVTSGWYHDAPSAVSVRALLAAAGWATPTPVSTVHRGGRRLLEHVDRTSRPGSWPAGFAVDPWSALDAGDARRIDGLKAEHAIRPGLHPDGETMLAISTVSSVVLRQGGEVAGWMLHHELGDRTLRYSSLWLRPDLVGRGLGLSLAIDAARRHLAIIDRWPEVFFLVSGRNDAMRRFIARRLQDGIERSSTLLRSEKTLAEADEKPASGP